MVHDAIVALELVCDAGRKARFSVEPRDFVFILVGHQLEQGAGDGPADGIIAQRSLGGAHAIHQTAVARGIGRVLIVGQEGLAAGDDRVERSVGLRFRVEQALQRVRLFCRQTADEEGAVVLLNGDAVEHDGLGERIERDGHEALLPGEAKHHHIGEHRVAHELFGKTVGVHGSERILARHAFDCGKPPVDAKARIALAHDIAGGHLGKVHHRAHAGTVAGRRLGGGRHDNVAADQGVGGAPVNAHLMNGVG